MTTVKKIQEIKKQQFNDANPANVSPRTQWGKLVIYLREHNNIALHIACGDITEVDVCDNKFQIYTTEKYIIELLSNEENAKQLKNAISWLGYSDYEIIQKQKKKSAEDDIKTLKKYFGDYLIIK